MPMADADNTASTVNKATPRYIASEIFGIQQGFDILREYVAEGGPQDQMNWLCDILGSAIGEALENAEAMAALPEHAGV